MTVETPVVELRKVGVRFQAGDDATWALKDVSVSLAAGSSTAVVGRSGSGKSTLVSILALLRQPTLGEVTVAGTSAHGLKDADLARLRSQYVGTVFQSFHLDPAMSAAENVMLPWYFDGRTSRASARARAALLLDRMGMGDLAGRRPTEMSGGQRQRVAIARAMFTEPRIVIADEPTGNLDEATADVIADELFSLPQRMGTAVVVVTHDTEIAARANNQIHISGGELCRV